MVGSKGVFFILLLHMSLTDLVHLSFLGEAFSASLHSLPMNDSQSLPCTAGGPWVHACSSPAMADPWLISVQILGINGFGTRGSLRTMHGGGSAPSHRWQPIRLLHPWDSPGKNTGEGRHFLLQSMKVKSESEVAQSGPTLSDPMDCSLPGSSVPGILWARILEWVAISFSKACMHASRFLQ